MKRIIIAFLIVAVAASFIIIPILGQGEATEKKPAEFLFNQNLQMVYGDKVELLALVDKNEGVKRVELFYDDESVMIWENPRDTLHYVFDSKIKEVGTRPIVLVTTFSDGEEKKDNRYIRVVSDLVPEQLTLEIAETYPHQTESFTQGLEFYNGKLFESTGLLGKSLVAEVDLKSGEQNADRIIRLDGTHFGEGITILNDIIYQLTWQNQKCLTYKLGDHIVPDKDFFYNGEGWGLCNDGNQLIMSNGTEHITFRDPSDFSIKKSIQVYNDLGPVSALNELEYIDGKIYANIWQSTKIVVIDPLTGKVLQEIDASSAVNAGKGASGEVLNGIAHNKGTGKTYITGKNWEKLLEVRFIKIAA